MGTRNWHRRRRSHEENGFCPRLSGVSAGILAAMLALSVCAAAEGAEAKDLDAAVTATRRVCRAMVLNNPMPMQNMFGEGPIFDRLLVEVRKEMPVRRKKDESFPPDPGARILEAWRQHACVWAERFAGGRYVIGATEKRDGEVVVLARMEGKRAMEYWRFHYRVAEGEPRLANLELPLLGMDVGTSVIGRTVLDDAQAEEGEPPTQEKGAKPHPLTYLLALGGLCIILLTVLRKGRSGDEAQRMSRRSLLFMGAGLILVVFVFLLHTALLKRAGRTSRSPARQLATSRRFLFGLFAEGELKDAERVARAILKRNPQDLFTRVLLVRTLIGLSKPDDARPFLNEMLENKQALVFAHDRLANMALGAGNYAEAIHHLEAVLADLGEDDFALTAIADVHLRAGNNTQAKRLLDRALELNGSNHEALRLRDKCVVPE